MRTKIEMFLLTHLVLNGLNLVTKVRLAVQVSGYVEIESDHNKQENN